MEMYIQGIIKEKEDLMDLKEADYLPALLLGSWVNLEHKKNYILFILHLKQGLKTNQAQHLFKSLTYLNAMGGGSVSIYQELSRFQSAQCNTTNANANSNANLSEREQKCQYIQKIDTSESARLYGLCFLIYKPEAHTAGLMLGSCEHIITDLTSRKPNGILSYYTHNEIIELFMDRINQFAKISTRLKLFTPEIKYVYTLFVNTFKKQILLINK